MTEKYILTPSAQLELVGVDYSYEKRTAAWKNFEKRIDKKNIYAFPGFLKIIELGKASQEQKNILQKLGYLPDLEFEKGKELAKKNARGSKNFEE